MDCIALRHTHTTSLRCHPHVPTFESCPILPAAQTILPDAQVILLGSANHFDEDHVSWDLPAGQPPLGHLARQLTASRLFERPQFSFLINMSANAVGTLIRI